MTIGYGTRDVFFDNCWEASVLIFLESIVSILLDCISLGIVYSLIQIGNEGVAQRIQCRGARESEDRDLATPLDINHTVCVAQQGKFMEM